MSDTNVITDRHAIADAVTAGLQELDQLAGNYRQAQEQVAVAQTAEAQAAEIYTDKINEVLATGWATPAGLAAQGHEVPKKRASTRAKRAANSEHGEQDSTDNPDHER
ncbi:hypothetical protein A5658_04950 [Mycobacterium sp. 1245111.1]|uniref:hypothetical protein n=1 Tax=Mycobacterium sp. 1245111.1 TaxID=1834073 RepID=UPI0008006B95|nr:hypothetical protein [Mycobacterium sp. 1245111.1]OBK37009.1 hypothetical protein A5658_04950 [Mycobacterium sp. 1245111.1]